MNCLWFLDKRDAVKSKRSLPTNLSEKSHIYILRPYRMIMCTSSSLFCRAVGFPLCTTSGRPEFFRLWIGGGNDWQWLWSMMRVVWGESPPQACSHNSRISNSPHASTSPEPEKIHLEGHNTTSTMACLCEVFTNWMSFFLWWFHDYDDDGDDDASNIHLWSVF